MNTEELTLVPESEAPHVDALPRADALAIWDGYREKIAKLKATAETLTVTDVSQKAEMKLARATRLTLKEVRVEIESRRKELGEEALRRKQKVDSAAKELKDIIEPLETRLLEQEQFAERAEAAAKFELLTARSKELAAIGVNAALYNLSDMPAVDYDSLLAGHKAAIEAKKIADAKAEADRIAKEKADAEERQRVAAENAKLKAEAAQREADMKAEREAMEAKARADREEFERIAKAEREAEAKRAEEAYRKAKAEQDAADAEARKEREARERAEAELKANKDAEDKQRAAELAAKKKAAQAPDKTKLLAFAESLRAIPSPDMATDAGKELLAQINEQIDGLADSIKKQATSL